MPCQLDRKTVRIARFILRVVDTPQHAVARATQRRLERQALGGGLHFAPDAKRAHRFRMAGERLEIALVGGELQDAALEVVVADAELRAQGAQAFAAVAGEAGQRAAVALETAREAFEQKAQAPLPLRPVGARAEQQRRILAPQPAQKFRQHGRLGPGLGVAGGDLPAVGERGLQAGGLAPLDDGDLVAGLGEVPGAGDADHARAENDDFHWFMIAPCPFSHSASGARRCSATITTSRTTRPWSATSRCTTTSTSGSRS